MLKELKKTGNGFVEENFTISKDIVRFLQQSYDLGKEWVDGSRFLEYLEIPLKIRATPETVPIMWDDCEIKFGYCRSVKYFSGESTRDNTGEF